MKKTLKPALCALLLLCLLAPLAATVSAAAASEPFPTLPDIDLIPGDVTGDGVIDVEDLLAVIDHIFEVVLLEGKPFAAAAFLASDGWTIDVEVLLALVELIFNPPPPRPTRPPAATTTQAQQNPGVPAPTLNTEAATPNPNQQVDGMVPKGPAVDGSYFSDAFFIGDSNLLGMFSYGYLPNAGYMCANGPGTWSLNSSAYDMRGGRKLPFDDALAAGKPAAKIYIQFGMNDVDAPGSWLTQRFEGNYRAMLERVRAVYPTQPIYVMAVMPIAKTANDATTGSNANFTQGVIDTYNSQINAIAQSLPNVHYLAVDRPYKDDLGFLIPGTYVSDGKHIRQAMYTWWVDYLYTHTVG